MRSYLEYHVHFWAPQYEKYVGFLDGVHRRTTKIIKGLEHLSYEKRLKELALSVWRREGSVGILLCV